MGFCALGLGFMKKKKKNNRKMGMGFQFEQHRLGLWDLSWDLKKKINFLGNGIRTPPSRPSLYGSPSRQITYIFFVRRYHFYTRKLT